MIYSVEAGNAVPLIMLIIILLQCKLFLRHLSFLWKRQRRVPLGLKSAQVENEAKSICLKSYCTTEFGVLSPYIYFLGSPLHLDSKVCFSVLGIFFIGLFLTSFFVPLMVNRYCFVLKNFLFGILFFLYHIRFKVWAPHSLCYRNPSGNLVGGTLWHNRVCLPTDPIPGLRLPRPVNARLQHGYPLVLHLGHPPGKPPHTPCSCLRPH